MAEATGRPKTLLISPWTPYPLVFGGAIRVYYLIKMLATFSDVTLVAFRTWTDVPDTAEHLEAICEGVVLVDGKPAQSARLRVRSTLSLRSFQHHAHHTEAMQQAIDDVCATNTFDTVVVTLTQMGSYELPGSPATRILDMHNIEHELLLRRASLERRLPKRAGLWLEGVKFRREERAICRSFDLVLTPSDRERDLLDRGGEMPPIVTVPNTIDAERIGFLPSNSTSSELLFVGTTQVDANRNGLLWFVNEVLPVVERAAPDVHLRIVGGSPPPEIEELGERDNVVISGYVPDIAPVMAAAAVFVVPLRVGGGTRLKILESLAYGVPTVSTTIGAEGLALVDGQDLLLGDTPSQFADQVVALLRDRALADRIRHRGRAAVESAYTWQVMGGLLEQSIDGVRAGMS